MQEIEARIMSTYLIALEAAAVEYAAKYGVSDIFSHALSCKPKNEAFKKLDDYVKMK